MADRTALLTAGERAWLDRLILPLPRGATILDLGCGGGEPVDRYLIDHGLHIVGLDSRATLIELARTRFPRERWLLGDMRIVALDETYAAVVAWNSLHQLTPADHDALAERAMAWLQPGGRLLFNATPVTRKQDEGLGGALARRGMVEMAHVESDASCDGAAVWLFRKP
jgi:cyclopropane fatty-acyl-phospholipid synthase-like methyltransferase